MDNVAITQQDIAQMLQMNPLAAEQVKSIALQRMLAEKEAELEALKAEKPNEQ